MTQPDDPDDPDEPDHSDESGTHTQTKKPRQVMYELPEEVVAAYQVALEAVFLGSKRSIQTQTVPCIPPLETLPPKASVTGTPRKKKPSKKPSSRDRHPPVQPLATDETAVSVRFHCTFPGCNSSYTRRNDLTRHQDKHKDVSFTCAICNEVFALKKYLAEHLKKHSGDGAHVCHVCGKSLSTKGSLQSHLQVHSGDKPFPCPNCDSGYTSKSALQRHIKSCGKSMAEKQLYACPKCSQKLSSKTGLKYHLADMHDKPGSYVCPKCGKKLNSRGALSKHHCPGG